MRKLNCFTAIREAMYEEMKRDESVFLMGEDVRLSVFGTSNGLLDEFGPDRVYDTPLSEAGFIGAGVGAAMVGMRPVVDNSMGSFMYVAMDQIVSMAAKTTYTYGGQYKVPLVIRASMPYNVSNAAQHSDRPYPMFMNVPGLKIVIPSNAHDMYGLLRTSIRDDDPVIIFEDRRISTAAQDVPEDLLIPLGVGNVVKEGRDITVVGIGNCVNLALEAAETLAKDGIDIEVIDPRTLVPLDKDLIISSVKKTGRLVVAETANKTCGAAAEIAAIICEEAFSSLKGPILRVTTDDVPVPFSKTLEPQIYPSTEKIIAAVKGTFK